MINFDKLPNDIPSNDFPLVPEGKHLAKITKAEMKEKKDGSSEYLSLTWEIYTEDGTTKLGNVFDIITESDSQYMQYKLRKFMEALNINLGPRFELRDLTKVCLNKMATIAVTISKDNRDQDRSQVNMFDKNMYTKYDEPFMPAPTDSVPFDEAASAENY